MFTDISLQFLRSVVIVVATIILVAIPASAQQRPMTFIDVQLQRSAGSWTPSPDGRSMLYTVRTPDWQEETSQTDIHLVSMEDGMSSSRQLTYTDHKDETQPTWAPDGTWFVFASDRDSENGDDQLYMMRHDGGEARKITDAKDGVTGFEFSPDGVWLVYRSGDAGQQQLFRMSVTSLSVGQPEKITSGEAGVEEWSWSPDGSTVYFVRPDAYDGADYRRRDAGFTVDVRNQVTALSSLWEVSMGEGEERILEQSDDYSVDNFNVSDDGLWISFTGGSGERYERNITASRLYADQYLLELSSGHVERLTHNYEVGESSTQFSPDGN